MKIKTNKIMVRFLNCVVSVYLAYREILSMKDGGEVAIDWQYPKSDGPLSSITIVILTGLTGNSQSEYVRETVTKLYEKGYCCVVFNYRGRGGVKLKVKRNN